MYKILGILFIIIGIVMEVKPDLFYQITESWKDTTNSEPSPLYIISTRVGGVAFIIVGLLCVLFA